MTYDDWKATDRRFGDRHDIDAPVTEPEAYRDYGPNIWCGCGVLLVGEEAVVYGECDFCHDDRMNETAYRVGENEWASAEQRELGLPPFGPLASQSELPF